MTISLIYYRFIVRFTIGLELLFIPFLLKFFLAQMSSLSISSSATYSSTFSNHIYVSIDRCNIGIFESCYASRVCIESTAGWCCHRCYPPGSEKWYTFLVAVVISSYNLIVNSDYRQ